MPRQPKKKRGRPKRKNVVTVTFDKLNLRKKAGKATTKSFARRGLGGDLIGSTVRSAMKRIAKEEGLPQAKEAVYVEKPSGELLIAFGNYRLQAGDRLILLQA